jgi:hypothetical protein
MKLSDATQISLPARNLLAILAAVAIGTMSFFSIQERLNTIETKIQLMEKDLEAANNFIDGVPKGDMVSPMILKNDMVIQFHEERLIDLEERKNGDH